MNHTKDSRMLISPLRLLNNGFLVVLLITAVNGCGGANQGNRFPVSGRVYDKSGGVPKAAIQFTPIDSANKSMAYGDTDTEGRFQLRYGKGKNGVSPGKYQVIINVMSENGPVTLGEGGEVGMSPKAKPPREYVREATISADGENVFEFDITKR